MDFFLSKPNFRVHIEELPSEILVQIFQFLSSSLTTLSSSAVERTQLYNIRLVCSRWNHLYLEHLILNRTMKLRIELNNGSLYCYPGCAGEEKWKINDFIASTKQFFSPNIHVNLFISFKKRSLKLEQLSKISQLASIIKSICELRIKCKQFVPDPEDLQESFFDHLKRPESMKAFFLEIGKLRKSQQCVIHDFLRHHNRFMPHFICFST
ncbi:hypothetical protein L596_024875 [Steinernema carpocapsae]|uniref:F-box domain-containing protein n=1 Tax=Steinernema carpocapsae TaxID=34508 RepID=A0A4U5M635_STECR|nr:hypothetical protein L596_024875 [Steinernema carpocapsae]